MKINKSIKIKIISSIFPIVLLSACSSAEDDLKIFMKCGIAAHELGQQQADVMINKKMKEHIETYDIQGSAWDANLMVGEIRNEELKLYEKSNEGQLYTLAKTYNSSECEDIHEQSEISMPLKYYLLYFFI